MTSKQHPTPSRPCTILFICTVFQLYVTIYMCIHNFMKKLCILVLMNTCGKLFSVKIKFQETHFISGNNYNLKL